MQLVLAATFCCSFILGLILVLVMHRLAPAMGLVDRPGGRTTRARPMPLGGMAVLLAAGLPLLGAVLLAWMTRNDPARLTSSALLQEKVRLAAERLPLMLSILAGGLAFTALGTWDDRRNLRAPTRLVPQVLIALAVSLTPQVRMGLFIQSPVAQIAVTTAWIVLLANNGAVNNALVALRLIREPVKFMLTQTGVTIGLVHFGLPIAILSLVGVIETVDRSLEEAARGLGANPLQTFLRITLPLTLPGIAAASMLVFSSAVAAFVIPALMGGPTLIVLPTLIYQQMVDTLEWGFGGAVATILLLVSTGLFLLYQRLLALARGLGQVA